MNHELFFLCFPISSQNFLSVTLFYLFIRFVEGFEGYYNLDLFFMTWVVCRRSVRIGNRSGETWKF